MSHVERKAVDLLLKTNLSAFIQRSIETLAAAENYQHNWHIDAMAWHLEQTRIGAITRLLITVPPRYLKSISASVCFPAFVLGHNPAAGFVCVSYSAELAAKLARDSRRIMESDWYRRIFPATRLSSEKNAEMDFMTTAQGYRYSSSMGGPITGRGGKYIVLDDPLNATDAMSDAHRTRVNEIFDRTLYSRQNDKRNDRIIIVGQRLHVDDLIGCALRKEEKWMHLNLPAIANTDEQIPIGRNRVHHRQIEDVLHPEREPRETLATIKAALGLFDYSAQYLQLPIPEEGEIIKWEWFPTYDEVPARQRGDRIIQSWDTALTDGRTSDYSVGLTFLVRGNSYYLLDNLREKLRYPDLRRRIYENWQIWGAHSIIIEDRGSGTSLIQELRGDSFPGFPKPIAFKPEGDKLTRIHAQSAKIEARHVYLPANAIWLPEFRSELLQFPRGRYDDQVDALSQFLNWIERRRLGRTVVMSLSGVRME